MIMKIWRNAQNMEVEEQSGSNIVTFQRHLSLGVSEINVLQKQSSFQD